MLDIDTTAIAIVTTVSMCHYKVYTALREAVLDQIFFQILKWVQRHSHIDSKGIANESGDM